MRTTNDQGLNPDVVDGSSLTTTNSDSNASYKQRSNWLCTVEKG